jgi:hypothetical protein
MAAENEKATIASGVTGSPKPSTVEGLDVNAVGDSDSTIRKFLRAWLTISIHMA